MTLKRLLVLRLLFVAAAIGVVVPGIWANVRWALALHGSPGFRSFNALIAALSLVQVAWAVWFGRFVWRAMGRAAGL